MTGRETRATVPWPFSEPVEADEGVPNLPTSEGRLIDDRGVPRAHVDLAAAIEEIES